MKEGGCIYLAMIHEFSKSLKIGEEGEEHILEYLRMSDNVSNIIDVRDSKVYQEIDVDFLAELAGKEYKIEVKTDTYLSGNMYYETISAEEYDSIGCFEKTQADFMFYYFINAKTLYILSMNEYRDWFKSKQEEFDTLKYKKRPINKGRKGSTYTSVGYAFPVSLLEKEAPRWMRKVYLNF